MQTFSEQLIAARKAKGMTQEALAQAVDVARNTISSWERGRTIPNIDSVRRLSDVLGVDFSNAIEEQSAGKNAAPPAPDAQQGPAEGQRRRKAPWIVAGVAALCAVALALCLLFGHKPAPAGGQDGFDAQAYQQETPNESDKAYLTIDHRTWEESGDGSAYQLYDFTLTENNGVGFTVTRLDLQLEGKSGAIRSMRYGDDDLRASKIDPDIPPYGRLTIDGGFPKGEFTRMGVTVYGTDANGTPLTFRHLITF